MKPNLDRKIRMVSIHLRPWKGKINTIAFPHGDIDIIAAADRMVSQLKVEGKFKRRTVESVSVKYYFKL